MKLRMFTFQRCCYLRLLQDPPTHQEASVSPDPKSSLKRGPLSENCARLSCINVIEDLGKTWYNAAFAS